MINKKSLNLFLIFCIFIVICIFLSSTLSNISTPRVVAGYASNGTLHKETVLDGCLYSQNIEEVSFELASEYPYNIKAVNVEVGDVINIGDVIYQIDGIPQSLIDDINIAEENYDYYLGKFLLEQAKAGVNDVNFDSASFVIYEELIGYEKDLLLMELNLITDADNLGLLDNSMTYLEKLEYLMTDRPEHLSGQVEEIIEIQGLIAVTLDLMKEKFDRTNGKGIYEYSQIIDADRKLQAAEYDLFTLEQKKNDIDDILSPVSGIVVEVSVEAGEEYSGGTVITVIDNSIPFIQCSIDDSINEESLDSNQYTIVYNDNEYKAELSKYSSIDNTIILTFLDESILKVSSLLELYGSKVSVVIDINAGEGTLIPLEALHGCSGKQIIYLLNEERGFWGNEWTITTMEVEIVDYNYHFALINEIINKNQQIVVGWDRSIFDGQTVLPFNN